MLKDRIASRFVGILGFDVSVSVNDPVSPTELVLYRPIPLLDDLVRKAFSTFEEADPEAAAGIEAVYVCYMGRLGRTRKRVRVRSSPGGAVTSIVPPALSADLNRAQGEGPT